MVSNALDWMAGIPPEHRAEARVLRDEIKVLRSNLYSMAQSYGVQLPRAQSADVIGEQVHDHATQVMNDAAALQSLFMHENETIRTDATRMQTELTEKETRLESLRVKK